MRIYTMTATFGKLENQTLKLEPGMNVISAPNEWGKSTWCAFLATMLYGLDTKEKNTKNNLALKERYAPWSGAPMSGRMDFHWEGRDITIERFTKGRTPMGEFRAYETESGLPVPELTATNCGETLLGVEKSVFLRAGFLRLADLPVTADDSLRRRLNALVTTGDESSTGDELGKKLKELKNKCRSNRTTGLIPQAESQKTALEEKLQELQMLQARSMELKQQLEDAQAQLALLENHKLTLEYLAAEENLQRSAIAQEAARQGAQHLQEMETTCRNLPSQETAQQQILSLQQLQQQQLQAREAVQLLPQPPREPGAPMCFYGLDGAQALARVREDTDTYQALSTQHKKAAPLWIPGLIAAATGFALLAFQLLIPAILLLAMGAGLVVFYGMERSRYAQVNAQRTELIQAIRSRYGGGEPADWQAQADTYHRQQQEYAAALSTYDAQRQDATLKIQQLDQAVQEATNGMGIPAALAHWDAILRQHAALSEAQQQQRQREEYAQAMAAMVKPISKPAIEDPLDLPAQATLERLALCRNQIQLLQHNLGQHLGRMEALGSETALRHELEAVQQRLQQLYRTNSALELALQTLQTATDTLQRRFAPRIAEQARELFGKLTNGRYDRLTLTQELSVDAATTEDVAIRSIQRRSEGTIDQLYLALRLAVARELTPHAPLILDDALVRFDDVRHAAAMQILREEAQQKQVILFTCHSRER